MIQNTLKTNQISLESSANNNDKAKVWNGVDSNNFNNGVKISIKEVDVSNILSNLANSVKSESGDLKSSSVTNQEVIETKKGLENTKAELEAYIDDQSKLPDNEDSKGATGDKLKAIIALIRALLDVIEAFSANDPNSNNPNPKGKEGDTTAIANISKMNQSIEDMIKDIMTPGPTFPDAKPDFLSVIEPMPDLNDTNEGILSSIKDTISTTTIY